MKTLRYILLAGFLPFATAQADPAAFVGISYSFGGGGVGISAKVLSDDDENKGVIGGGVTYYPLTNQFGLGVGVGSTFDNGAALIGWDFLQNGVEASIGWADTEDNKRRNTVAPDLND